MSKGRSGRFKQEDSFAQIEPEEAEVALSSDLRDENYFEQNENDSEGELDHAEFIQNKLNQVRET
jgi:hypothetical protein